MYLMRCLLCEPGSEWNPPDPKGHADLTKMQEHLMSEHDATQDDLRYQKSSIVEIGIYEYRLPDGRTWLRAWWVRDQASDSGSKTD